MSRSRAAHRAPAALARCRFRLVHLQQAEVAATYRSALVLARVAACPFLVAVVAVVAMFLLELAQLRQKGEVDLCLFRLVMECPRQVETSR